MSRSSATILALLAFLPLSGCVFHSNAKDWNGLVGRDGEPAYYKTTTKVGLNLLVLVPFLGDLDIDGLVDDLTEEIADEHGDRVRLVQGSSENYWYGFPPFTWIVTPVVATVAAEYQPDLEQFVEDQEEIRDDKEGESGLNPMEW